MSQCDATLRRPNGTLPWSSDNAETTETLQDWRSRSCTREEPCQVCSGAQGKMVTGTAATCDQYAGDYVSRRTGSARIEEGCGCGSLGRRHGPGASRREPWPTQRQSLLASTAMKESAEEARRNYPDDLESNCARNIRFI